MVTPAEAVAAIPDDLAAAEAAPLLCAGITVFNALRNAGARAGDLVAVQGIGGLGHLGIQYARQMGFRTFAIGRGKDKEALARKLGATHYVDAAAGDPSAELQKFGGARVILATAPDSKSMSAVFNGLSSNGKLIVVGASADAIAVTPLQLQGQQGVARMGFRNRHGLRRHHAVQRAVGSPSHDRKVSAGKGSRGLRADDQRPGALSRGADHGWVITIRNV